MRSACESRAFALGAAAKADKLLLPKILIHSLNLRKRVMVPVLDDLSVLEDVELLEH